MTTPFRPRVAVVAPGELYGGVERHVTGLCEELGSLGLPEPLVVLFHDREQAAQIRDLGIEPVILTGRGRYDLGLAGRLRGLLEERSIDVAHLHGYRGTATLGSFGPLPDVAVVKTEHGRPEPTGGRILDDFKKRLNHALDDRATRRLDAVVCYVTAELMGHFDAAHAGLDRRVVYNGIAPLEAADYPRPAELEGPGPHFGLVGRVSEVKSIGTAVQAMADAAMPDGAVLHVVGTGPLRESLEAEAATLGVGDRVRFHGFRRDVFAFMAHLDALLMPSLHEGLPYTLLEAMSLGTPVIASRVGGLAEVIADGETGLLIERGDAAALAARCADVAGDPGLRDRLVAGGRADLFARFTQRIMTEAYLEAYADVVARRRS